MPDRNLGNPAARYTSSSVPPHPTPTQHPTLRAPAWD